MTPLSWFIFDFMLSVFGLQPVLKIFIIDAMSTVIIGNANIKRPIIWPDSSLIKALSELVTIFVFDVPLFNIMMNFELLHKFPKQRIYTE